MDELIKAIVAEYGADKTAASDLRALTPGGLWADDVPQQATGTYIILTMLGDAISHIMGSGAGHPYTTDGRVQFSICDPSSMLAAALAKPKLIALYEDNILTLDNHTVLYARRATNGLPIRDPDGEGCSIAIEFRYVLGNK